MIEQELRDLLYGLPPAAGQEDTRPEIPYLPGALAVITEAEQRIASDPNGVHLDMHMESWLRRHGVHQLAELHCWEEWFVTISRARSSATARRLEAARRGTDSDDEN